MLHDPGDVALVERGRPRHLVVRCPCGCGDDISLNVDPQAGPNWRLLRHGEHVTLMPSVWRETGCESHFFVWRDEVDWLDWYNWDSESVDAATCNRVFQVLRIHELRSVHEIASEVEVPLLTAFHACQKLVAENCAEEGQGQTRGLFRALLSTVQSTNQ